MRLFTRVCWSFVQTRRVNVGVLPLLFACVSTAVFIGASSTNISAQQPRKSGDVSTEVLEYDWDANGIPNSRRITTKTYDDNGRLTATVLESDNEADGIVDSRDSTTKAYDARGN